MNAPNTDPALARCIARILRPVCRLLLRSSLPYSALEAVARREYVQCATEEFALNGRRQSISRVAILTGLTRKEVSNILESPGEVVERHLNRAARALMGWSQDERFCSQGGEPRVLPIGGPNGFADLVRIHCGDMPAIAVLDELLRMGAVRVTDDGSVRFVQDTRPKQSWLVADLQCLGEAVDSAAAKLSGEASPADPQLLALSSRRYALPSPHAAS